MGEIIYKEEIYVLMGACFNVHKDKGCGFLEPVYQECMEIELAHASIPFIAKPALELSYREKKLRTGLRLLRRYHPGAQGSLRVGG